MEIPNSAHSARHLATHERIANVLQNAKCEAATNSMPAFSISGFSNFEHFAPHFGGTSLAQRKCNLQLLSQLPGRPHLPLAPCAQPINSAQAPEFGEFFAFTMHQLFAPHLLSFALMANLPMDCQWLHSVSKCRSVAVLKSPSSIYAWKGSGKKGELSSQVSLAEINAHNSFVLKKKRKNQ